MSKKFTQVQYQQNVEWLYSIYFTTETWLSCIPRPTYIPGYMIKNKIFQKKKKRQSQQNQAQ